MRYLTRTLPLLSLLATPTTASAYVGPGLGLGAIGLILALVISILLAIIGLFWFPLKRKIGKRSKREHGTAETIRDHDGAR